MLSWQWKPDIYPVPMVMGHIKMYPIVMATIQGTFRFWATACITISLYYIKFYLCIYNLASEYM